MTDITANTPADAKQKAIDARIRRRYLVEHTFRFCGIAALGVAGLMLVFLMITIIGNGFSGFLQTKIEMEVFFDPAVIDPEGTRNQDTIIQADWRKLQIEAMKKQFPEVTERKAAREMQAVLSGGAHETLRRMVLSDPSLIGQTQKVWLVASDQVDGIMKGFIKREEPEHERGISDTQLQLLDQLLAKDVVAKKFNWEFLTTSNSREPELAGLWGAVVGTFWTMLVTLLVSFPIGVSAAVYLEEFAPRNRFTDFVEVNINNLAAVPSIVYGLLGLVVFIQAFGLPRSAPIVGGLTIALMTLPTIIIASRAALKSVPPSIRQAALGMGATRLQTVMHHTLPLAMPGILTGTILGMAHALGETAPLLMIGMVAFVIDVPDGAFTAATVLPVQIFMWADSPERAFVERTSAAIIVLLLFMAAMNLVAIYLRKKFERRW